MALVAIRIDCVDAVAHAIIFMGGDQAQAIAVLFDLFDEVVGAVIFEVDLLVAACFEDFVAYGVITVVRLFTNGVTDFGALAVVVVVVVAAVAVLARSCCFA